MKKVELKLYLSDYAKKEIQKMAIDFDKSASAFVEEIMLKEIEYFKGMEKEAKRHE